MMFFVLALVVCGCVHGAWCQQQQQQQYYDQQQYQRPQVPLPAIVMHKQALGTDGSFNYAFAADNGLQQGETISPDGSRTGSYSYVDPNGKTISVKYSAGKDGFKILEGDHVPRAPSPQAQPQANYYQQQGAGLYHRAQPAPAVQQQYHPQPRQDGYSDYGSETRFAGIRDELNAIGSLGNLNPGHGYHVHEDHGERPAQPRIPNLFEGQPGGPVSYPPPQQHRPTNNNYYKAANTQQSEAPEEYQGPHTFGNGYSFEFAG